MKRLIFTLLCFTMLLGSAGCAVSAPPAESRSDEAGPVTLDWYVNYSWYNTPWGGNAVSRAVTEKTGVDIRFISPDGSESETLDALIAGGSLPDLVTLGWWETQLTEIVDGGMAYPLNELADQYDPSFWTVADQRRLAWYAHPDKAIQLMSFLMGEEGQKLIVLGIEGEHYQMVDGRAELTDEVKRLMREDYPAYVAQVGADDTYWMLQDNRMQARWKPLDDPALRQMEEWTYPYTCYTGQYDTAFVSGSEADAADKRIAAIHGEMLPQLLLAPTQEGFEALWDQYVSRREEAGLALLLEESTRQMNEAKAKLGLS